MKSLVAAICVTTVTLSGCTTLSENVELVSAGNETSDLIVYREGAFHASGASLYVGENEKYFMKLRNDQYVKVVINAGKHTFQAKADGSPASELEIDLIPGQTSCIKGEPNPDSLGAVLIPIVGNMVPTFILTQVPCPSQDDLAKYEIADNS